MLGLVASCTLISRTRQLEKVTLGIFQRVPIVSQTTIDREFVTTLVYLPNIVGCELANMFLDIVVVVAIVSGIVDYVSALLTMLIIEHIATIEPAAHSTLHLNKQSVIGFVKFPTSTTNLRIDTAISLTIGIGSSDIVIDNSGFKLMEVALALDL